MASTAMVMWSGDAGQQPLRRSPAFQDFRVLPFPQPCYPTGYWSCLIASKESRDLTRFRVQDAAARPFAMQYYSATLRQAALALPPFVEKALAD